jgi:hypothetical protein
LYGKNFSFSKKRIIYEVNVGSVNDYLNEPKYVEKRRVPPKNIFARAKNCPLGRVE